MKDTLKLHQDIPNTNIYGLVSEQDRGEIENILTILNGDLELLNKLEIRYKFNIIRYINGNILVFPDKCERLNNSYIFDDNKYYLFNDTLYGINEDGTWKIIDNNTSDFKKIGSFYIIEGKKENEYLGICKQKIFDMDFNLIGILEQRNIVNIKISEEEYIIEVHEQYTNSFYTIDKKNNPSKAINLKLKLLNNIEVLLKYQDLGVIYSGNINSSIIKELKEKTNIREINGIRKIDENGNILLFCENPNSTSAKGETGITYKYNILNNSLSKGFDFPSDTTNFFNFDICINYNGTVIASFYAGESLAYLDNNEWKEIKNKYYGEHYKVFNTSKGLFVTTKKNELYKLVENVDGFNLNYIAEVDGQINNILIENGLLIGEYTITNNHSGKELKKNFIIKNNKKVGVRWHKYELNDFQKIENNGEIFYSYIESDNDSPNYGTSKLISEKEFFELYSENNDTKEVTENISKQTSEILD